MRNPIRLIGLAAIVAASVSCGDVVRQGSSPMYLVINSLAPGGSTTPAPLRSDVINTAAPCSLATPCFTSDNGSVALSTTSKDVALVSPTTTNNDVTISRYHVEYTRADQHNTQGVDVPYAFDGAATITIPAGSSKTFDFTLVRNVAKQEAPLAPLQTSPNTITTIAQVTFYGVDRTGNAVSVMGTIQIDFGNFADK